MSSFCDNHNMCTFSHTILYSTKVKKGKTIHKSLTREKVDKLIVGFKGEALREECW